MNVGEQIRNFLSLLILLSAVANLLLGGLVLFDSPQRKVNRLFSLLCFNLSFWGIAFIGITFSAHAFSLLIWSRLYATSLILVAPLFYHLTLGSLGASMKGQSPHVGPFGFRFKQLAYVFSFGWVLFIAAKFFTGYEQPGASYFFTDFGQEYWITVVAFSLIALMSFYLLALNFKLSLDANQKNRLQYLLVGSVGILVGGILSFVLMHFKTGVAAWFITSSHLIITMCLVLIAYALTTSQMYQFTELSRKTIAFLVMTLILLIVFGGTRVLSNVLLLPYIPNSDYLALGISSVIMALLFHPLRFRVQNMVDRIFFSKRYDQMQRLRDLSKRVLSSADRDELLNTLFNQLREIGFGSVALVLKDPQKPLYQIKKSVGLGPTSDGFFLRSDSLLIQYLREEKSELIRDEVLRRIMTDWERQALGDEMGILEAEICFPLFSTRRRAMFGLLTLGNSELGNSSYHGRNVFWLQSVVENSGIMLDNFYQHELANALIPYVGRAWAEEMRRNKEGFRERLSGHRTWVSVIMVDIRKFTTMSARMDPREVVELLKDFRSHIAPIVYRHQGTIDKFIGDAVMIVFGLPILPKVDNPDRLAIACATDIAKEMEVMNTKRFEAGKKERVSVGIAVSSGEVIAGNVDSGDRVEYTVIGDAANMVAKLEDLAEENQVLISSATYDHVQGQVPVKKWPLRKVGGFTEPIQIYELILNPAQENSAPDSLAANQ